jgi:hypothetical protein
LARDTSLYFLGGLVNGVGVPRDTATTNGDWTHYLTERSQVQLDASWARVRYSEPAGVNSLIDYRYITAGPTFATALSERNTLKLLGSYGLYQSLDGTTESRSESLQLAFVRQLTEIWALSASAGYTHSANSEKIYETAFFGTFYLGTFKSNQNSAVYAATLTRQGERLNFSVSASRALQPTGFAFLSLQDSFNLGATYTRSERWDFAAAATWLKAVNPQANGAAAVNRTETSSSYVNASVTANWHWTPQWTVSLTTAQIAQRYSGPPPTNAGSTNITITFVRQFLRTQF